MPNHVTTVVTMTGSQSDIDRFCAAHIVDDNFLFETIIPKPPCVDKTESGTLATAGFYALTGCIMTRFIDLWSHPFERYRKDFEENPKLTSIEFFREWLEVHDPEAIEKGKATLACFRETGFFDWYDWSIANWGTKWGAYEFKLRSREPERLVIEFQTAWNVADPIFRKLAELYQEADFTLAAIDEGGPEYDGHYSKSECRLDKVETADDRWRLVHGKTQKEHYGEDDAEEAS